MNHRTSSFTSWFFMSFSLFFVLQFCCLFCFSQNAFGDVRYRVVGLDISFASSVSSQNGIVRIAGNQIAPPPLDEYYEARWQNLRGNSVLFPALPGSISSYVQSLSGSQAVGATSFPGGENDGLTTRACLFSSDTTLSLDDVSNYSIANDINSFGVIVGGADFGNRDAPVPCFWNTTNGTMIEIGNSERGEAFAINDHNQIVGVIRGNDREHAMFMGGLNSEIVLLDLPGSSSTARDINNVGTIIGTILTDEGVIHSFVTSINAEPNYITSPDGIATYAHSINNAGFVVGQYIMSDPQSIELQAFVWHEDFGLLNLNDLVDPNTGWDLRGAMSISDDGHIVGYGFDPNGEYRGFLLAPIPCPGSTFVLILLTAIRIRQRS